MGRARPCSEAPARIFLECPMPLFTPRYPLVIQHGNPKSTFMDGFSRPGSPWLGHLGISQMDLMKPWVASASGGARTA